MVDISVDRRSDRKRNEARRTLRKVRTRNRSSHGGFTVESAFSAVSPWQRGSGVGGDNKLETQSLEKALAA